MATHSSILTWKIPWTEEPWRAIVHEVANNQTRLSNSKTVDYIFVDLFLGCLFCFIDLFAILLSILHCLDYCSFLVNPEVT